MTIPGIGGLPSKLSHMCPKASGTFSHFANSRMTSGDLKQLVAFLLPSNRSKGFVNLSEGISGTMIVRLQSVALRIVIVCAMAVALVLAPADVSSSHEPLAAAQAEAERHLELATEIAKYGHSHEDGLDSERGSGHMHGHNSADHLHDTPSYPPSVMEMIVRTGNEWPFGVTPNSLPLRVIELARPPRA